MKFLPIYIYWILRGNISSHHVSDQDSFLRLWKTYSSPSDNRKPVETDVTHDMRIPVETAHDFNLRRPALPEESHDLRWPVVEEDSHDLRNPVHDDGSELLLSEFSEYIKDDHHLNGEEESDDDTFWRHEKVNVNKILNNEDVLRSCLPEFYKNYDADSGYGKIREASLKECGKTYAKSFPRLVGGKSSAYLQWPWMVSLRQRYRGEYRHKCGAGLLNSYWVVTAAHCVEWQPIWSLAVRLGSHNLNADDEPYPHLERSLEKKIIHSEFNPITFENDIALLKMDSPVEFVPNISPVCMPENVGNLTDRMAVVLGWGRVTDKAELSRTLQEAHLPVLSNHVCEKMYEKTGFSEKIPGTFLCAGTAEGGVDACDGDSGGPMSIMNEDGRWSLIGLVSWGKACAAPNQPGVYTRITEYLNWIEGTMACYSG